MSVRRRGPPRLPKDTSNGKRISWNSETMPENPSERIEPGWTGGVGWMGRTKEGVDEPHAQPTRRGFPGHGRAHPRAEDERQPLRAARRGVSRAQPPDSPHRDE